MIGALAPIIEEYGLLLVSYRIYFFFSAFVAARYIKKDVNRQSGVILVKEYPA